MTQCLSWREYLTSFKKFLPFEMNCKLDEPNKTLENEVDFQDSRTSDTTAPAAARPQTFTSDQSSKTEGYASESTSEEDYDALIHDPGTVVAGGKGGGFPGHLKTNVDPRTENKDGWLVLSRAKTSSQDGKIRENTNEHHDISKYPLTGNGSHLNNGQIIAVKKVCRC